MASATATLDATASSSSTSSELEKLRLEVEDSVLKNLVVEKLFVGSYQELPDPLPKSGYTNEGMSLAKYSIFPVDFDKKSRQALVFKATTLSTEIDSAVGAMVGMGVGDWMGHPFEFISVERAAAVEVVTDESTATVSADASEPLTAEDSATDAVVSKAPETGGFVKRYVVDFSDSERSISHFMRFTPWYERATGVWHNEANRFRLKRGQWTDDASMGLCQADSLLICRYFDGSDIRTRFWNWWFNSYNTAFTDRRACGLGGNIGDSICSMKLGSVPTEVYEVDHSREDSGNGSLMRLAAMPVFFHRSEALAVRYSKQSSFTTHPGFIAAECCALMATLIVRAMKRDRKKHSSMKQWMDETMADCLAQFGTEIEALLKQKAEESKVESESDAVPMATASTPETEECKEAADESVKKPPSFLEREIAAKRLAVRLLEAKEDAGGCEAVWNWRSVPGRLPVVACLNARKAKGSYNGYPVSGGYFGSYCMDGLAMALHCCYHSVDFADAIIAVINLLGDADTTGSIAGQMAGAFYGFRSIADSKETLPMVAAMNQWDNHAFEMHGVCLYAAGLAHDDASALQFKKQGVKVGEAMLSKKKKKKKTWVSRIFG